MPEYMENQYAAEQQVVAAANTFISKVFGWMGLGLLLTAVVAVITASTEAMVVAIFGNPVLFFGLIIGEVAMVFFLSARIRTLSASTATMMFLVYSALNGLTLSILLLVYTASSIYSTFFVTAAMFGAMAGYGYITKRDLTGLGSFMMMGLVGLIIGSVINLFFFNETMYWLLTIVGVIVFVGLTAYDMQKIKLIGANVDAASSEGRKAAIMGALALYLDFINLLIMMLRLMGRRR